MKPLYDCVVCEVHYASVNADCSFKAFFGKRPIWGMFEEEGQIIGCIQRVGANQGLLGYIFSEPAPGLVPLYEINMVENDSFYYQTALNLYDRSSELKLGAKIGYVFTKLPQ